MMISAPPDRDATNLDCMAQLQLGRLAIHRLPIFLCSVKVKGTAYRVVGLRDMLFAALETGFLPFSRSYYSSHYFEFLTFLAE